MGVLSVGGFGCGFFFDCGIFWRGVWGEGGCGEEEVFFVFLR